MSATPAHPFRALADLLADPRADAQANLRGDERLRADPDHGDEQREAEQPGAEADGELVDADAETESQDGEAARSGEQREPALLLVLAA